jgi:hypothetical protein
MQPMEATSPRFSRLVTHYFIQVLEIVAYASKGVCGAQIDSSVWRHN